MAASSSAAGSSSLGPPDGDNDGVVDAADNCPGAANPGQENEDGDMFGNACDRCPALSSTTQPDLDQDGVGDACDPSAARHTFAFFDGFDGPLDATAWRGEGNPWTAAGGQLQQSQTSNDGAAPLLVAVGLNPGTSFEVELRFAYTMVDPTVMPDTHNVGVTLGLNGGNTGWYVGVIHRAGHPSQLNIYVLTNNTADQPAAGSLLPGELQVGTPYTLRVQVQPDNITATVGSANVSHMLNTPLDGEVGLRTRRAAVAVDYLQVIQLAP